MENMTAGRRKVQLLIPTAIRSGRDGFYLPAYRVAGEPFRVPVWPVPLLSIAAAVERARERIGEMHPECAVAE